MGQWDSLRRDYYNICDKTLIVFLLLKKKT